jgi:hypothetical protein
MAKEFNFRVGQKVVFKDYDDEDHLKEEIGVITRTDGDLFTVKTKDGDEDFDSCELRPYTFRRETFARARKLERHPLFELAEQNPVFVVDGKVYTSGEGKNNNFYRDKKSQRGLVEVASLSDLDELAFERAERGARDIKKWYAQTILKYLNAENSGEESVQKFIFEHVFPHFRDNGQYKEKVASLLGAKPVKRRERKRRLNQDCLEQAVDNLASDITVLKSTVRDYPVGEELVTYKLSGLIWRQNFALVDGRLCFAFRVSGDNRARIQIGEERFSLEDRGTSREAEKAYQDALARKIQTDALKGITREELMRVLKANNSTAFANLTEYQEKNFGFVRVDEDTDRDLCMLGAYFVFLEIPAFGIKSPFQEDKGNPYYLFEKSRIAIPIFKSDGKFHYDDYVYYGSGKDIEFYKDLCIGDARLPEDGKDIGEVVAKRLKQVRNMVFAGNSYDWYHRIDFYEKSSLPELKRRGLRIRIGMDDGKGGKED